MATHISIRLWDEEERSPSVLLADIVRFLEHAPMVEKPWRWVRPGVTTNGRLDSREVLTRLNDLSERARISVGTTYHVHPEATKVFAVCAWNNAPDRAFMGDAELDFRHRLHFANAGLPPSEDVAQNVLELYELLRALVEEVSIDSVRAFHDESTFWPINAHFAYFGGPQAVIGDLQLLDRLWWLGDKKYGVKPLHTHRAELEAHFISHRESPRPDIYEQLHELMPYTGRVSEDIVLAELASSRFDVSQAESGGWFVMQFPDAFDHFIDGFYLDVLRRARDA